MTQEKETEAEENVQPPSKIARFSSDNQGLEVLFTAGELSKVPFPDISSFPSTTTDNALSADDTTPFQQTTEYTLEKFLELLGKKGMNPRKEPFFSEKEWEGFHEALARVVTSVSLNELIHTC
jgi:hypothetical protein